MSDVYLVVLAVEVDPSMGDPIDWHWPTLIDSPYSADAIVSIHAPDDRPVKKNIDNLTLALRDVHAHLVSERTKKYA